VVPVTLKQRKKGSWGFGLAMENENISSSANIRFVVGF